MADTDIAGLRRYSIRIQKERPVNHKKYRKNLEDGRTEGTKEATKEEEAYGSMTDLVSDSVHSIRITSGAMISSWHGLPMAKPFGY